MCVIMDEKQLNDRLDAIEKTLDQVLMIINSNHNTNQKGLAENVNDLRDDVNELKVWKTMINTKIVSYSTVVVVVVGIIAWIGDKLIHVFVK